MKKQFSVIAAALLPNGKVIVSGSLLGTTLPSPGERGKAMTPDGEIQVEVNSIPILDPVPKDPDKRALQVIILKGDHRKLEGITLQFASD